MSAVRYRRSFGARDFGGGGGPVGEEEEGVGRGMRSMRRVALGEGEEGAERAGGRKRKARAVTWGW